MKFITISLFPEMFGGVLGASMLFKAQDKNIVEFEHISLRDFGLGPRKQVDDTPYGGGDGMLLMIEPLAAAIRHAKSRNKTAKVVLMTPRGETLNQSRVRQFASFQDDLIIICPRYEGYDERVIELCDFQISIGNYVLTGGELPAMVLIDSVTRLLDGVLGGENSAEIESFSNEASNNLEFPQYTRPAVWNDQAVPEVLLSGNHGLIKAWRDKFYK